jgi:glycosyltransferase involved in cell wall biosynthesis
MTVSIDCRLIESSGIGVYLRECLPFFIKSSYNCVLIGDAKKLDIFQSTKNNLRIIDCTIRPFSLWELFFFPRAITKIINSTALFYSPFFNIPGGIKIPVYTTIHDIVFPDMPGLVSVFGLVARMWFYRRAYKKSKKVFTVSNFSKSRIEHHLGTVKPVVVTYSAIQKLFFEYRNNNTKVQKTETIVFIGNIKKHKGLDCLLEAFFLARKEGLPHRLVIVGAKENLRTYDDSISKKIALEANNAIVFTGNIVSEELLGYLSKAALLIQPSLYEGFGLPPLEAMVLGTQALISDIPVFKEIYDGFPVAFFQAGNSLDLKEKIIELLCEKKLIFPVLPDNLLRKYSFESTVNRIMEEWH